MNNLNSIIIEGDLVEDVVLKSTVKGTPVCSFVIENSRFHRVDKDHLEREASFFDVVAWGRLAEASGTYGHKGRKVKVVGRLKQDRWTGADGKENSKVVVVAEHVEWLRERDPEQEEEKCI
jgi:single-strand DNA-binding protein